MKIETIDAPSISNPQGAKAQPAMTALERAKAAFMKPTTPTQQQAQTEAVINPTQVSPEEFGAIKNAVKTNQIDTSESDESTTAPDTSAETKVSSEPLSSQYAVLARKEKAIRAREQQLKAKEAAIKAQEDAAKAAPKTLSIDESKYVPKDRLTQDPFTVLNELGLSYDQLTELALNAPKPEQMALMNELKSLKAEIAALKGESQSNKKSFEDQQKQNEAEAINQIRHEASVVIKNNPEFETIRETNSLDDVVDLIKRTYKEDGILMSVEEAALEVENYLVEEAIKLARLKKIQQRLQPAKPAETKATEQLPKQTQPMKTLTNSVASSRTLSARERALLAFEGKLQK